MEFYFLTSMYVVYSLWMLGIVYTRRGLDYITSAIFTGMLGLHFLNEAMKLLK